MSRIPLRVSFLAIGIALAAPDSMAAFRAFVSSTGNDANTASQCLLATPCRTFAAAHSVVDDGGEIVALDTAGYGPLTITKSVTIIGQPGLSAGSSASTGNAIHIETADIEVTLRNINVSGVGGTNGIVALLAGRVNIENCTVSNFTGAGIRLQNVRAFIVNTLVRNNGGSAVEIRTGATADISNSQALANGGLGFYSTSSGGTATVTDSVSSGNLYGAGADGGGSISVIRSNMSYNADSGVATASGTALVGQSQLSFNANYGLAAFSGTFISMGNNQGVGNGAGATTGTITAGTPF